MFGINGSPLPFDNFKRKKKNNRLENQNIKMKNIKKLGIWMDYSTANLIEYNLDSYEIKSIDSGFSDEEINEVLVNNVT